MKVFVAVLALLGAANAVTYDSGLEVEMVTVPDVCEVKVRSNTAMIRKCQSAWCFCNV